MKDVTLQPVWCPIPGAIHAEADTVERLAVKWLDDFQPYSDEEERSRLLATRSAEIISRYAPGADVEKLVAAAVFLYLDFGFDDAFCDAPEVQSDPIAFFDAAEQYQCALEIQAPVPVVGSDRLRRYCTAQYRAAAQLRALATPLQCARYATYHRSWLAGVQAQITTNALRQPLNVSDYLRQRMLSSGGWTAFGQVEFTGPEIPCDELNTPAVRALAEMMIVVASLDNDQHSALREQARGEISPTIFRCVRQGGGTSSAAEATALRDRVLTRFLLLRDRVKRDASPALRLLIDNLGYIIAGNVEWGTRVARYHGLHLSDVSLRRHAGPTDSADSPPGIDAIDWWWTV